MATQSVGLGDRVVVTHPNREKPIVQSTRAAVVFLLFASAALIAFLTATGWNVLEGAEWVQIVYVLVYLVLGYLALRWNRGALPISASLAVFLLIFAAVAAPGWFSHEKQGFREAALNADLMGILTLLVIPLQLLLIVFAMRGLSQGWNVEVERPADPSGRALEAPQGDARQPSGRSTRPAARAPSPGVRRLPRRGP